MKRIILGLCLAFLFATQALAQQPVWIVTPPTKGSTSGQVTCSTTATLVYSGPRSSLTMENFTAATVAVYLATSPNITASNAGLQLSSTLMTSYIDDKGQDDWYCITGSSTATVGVTVRP
jgi:hypothetical protein